MVIGDLIILALTCRAAVEKTRDKLLTKAKQTAEKIGCLIMDNVKVKLLTRTLGNTLALKHMRINVRISFFKHTNLSVNKNVLYLCVCKFINSCII